MAGSPLTPHAVPVGLSEEYRECYGEFDDSWVMFGELPLGLPAGPVNCRDKSSSRMGKAKAVCGNAPLDP